MRHPVQTFTRFGDPLTVARTRWMFGLKRRFVILRDHGRLLPKPGPLAQMSQTAATVNSWDCWDCWMIRDLRCPTSSRATAQEYLRLFLDANRAPMARCTSLTLSPAVQRGGAMSVHAVATFDLSAVLRFSDLALAALGEAREEIDALNVYPVPDGDTGTNMYLTFESARSAMLDALDIQRDARPDDLPDDLPVEGDLRAALVAFARGALLGARGNSGVIFSQLVGAFCKR